jgi:hypothetical protein
VTNDRELDGHDRRDIPIEQPAAVQIVQKSRRVALDLPDSVGKPFTQRSNDRAHRVSAIA